MSLHPGQVLLRPVVSEKSYEQITQHKYTFKVHQDAHKTQVRQAVEKLFKVKVAEVRTMNIEGKLRRRGKFAGYRSDWKKAYVKLKSGQKAPEYTDI